MKHIKEFILNETKTEDIILSEIIDGEIKVYEKSIRTLFKGIGDGIDDIDIVSQSLSGVWTPNSNEIQNEISIIFIDNAWGGISLEEWNGADKKLNNYKGKNGFDRYSINPNRNSIILEFERNFPMGLY